MADRSWVFLPNFNMNINGKINRNCKLVVLARDRDFLDLFEHTVGQNYSNRSFGLQELSDRMGFSKRQVQRKSKAFLGCTPSEYLRTCRLEKSLRLLGEGMPVNVVARAVGFSSQSYFASCFKAHFGRTPSDYQGRSFKALTD